MTSGNERTLELSGRNAERFDQIKEDWTEGGHLPEPEDESVLKGLLDTLEAVDRGHYSECDSSVCSLVRRLKGVFSR